MIASKIDIVIKSLIESEPIALRVSSDSSIRNVKSQIATYNKKEKKRNTPVSKIALIYDDTELDDGKTLKDYGFPNESLEEDAKNVIWMKMALGDSGVPVDALMNKTQERRNPNNRRWDIENIMRLLHGVEVHGTYQYKAVRELFFPEDSPWTPQDLYDKWRNLVKAAEAKLKEADPTAGAGVPPRTFRGVELPLEVMKRIAKANENNQSRKAQKERAAAGENNAPALPAPGSDGNAE